MNVSTYPVRLKTKRRVVTGFFYITNFGLTPEQIDQQYAIAKAFFSLPSQVKLSYRAHLEEGNYNGYRPMACTEIQPGIYDNIESYNIFKFIPQTQRPQPDIIRQYSRDIEKFQRHMHQNVTYKILRLLATLLEIPDDTLENGHSYESNCDSALRYMMYRTKSDDDDNIEHKNVYLRGHKDNGTLTYVFQQPVAALQVKDPETGEWRFLRVPRGKVAVNVADILQFLTNGYLKAGIHRVIAPQVDQAKMDRLGLLYFVRPTDELPLRKLDSPFLRRAGYGKEGTQDDLDIPASEWVRERVKKNWNPPSANVDKGGGFMDKIFYD